MTIKRGTALSSTGLLDAQQTRTARLLSLTTVDELADFLSLFPTEAENVFGDIDLTDVGSRAAAMSSTSVSALDSTSLELREVAQGLGALPPIGASAEVVAELAVDELDRTAPAGASDEPKVWLTGFGPVREQGLRSTCVAHAVAALHEYAIAKDDASFDLSEQFLYWLAKSNDGAPSAPGTWVRIAIPLALQYGICPESTWPYNATKTALESQGPPPDGASAAALPNRVSAGKSLDPTWVETVCAELDAGRPVAMSVAVFPNRRLAQLSGDFPMPLPGAVPDGGHAMCVVGYGYDDGFLGGGYLIVRNSWGTDWGSDSPFGPGHGTLPFGYVRRFAWEAASIDGSTR